MNSRSNIGGGSIRMSGPRISADIERPRLELTPEAFDRRHEHIDSDVEPGLDSHRSTYNTPSARDGPGGKSTGPRREPNYDVGLSDGEGPLSEAKKPMVKKWSIAEDVKREIPKKRFDYRKVPYERIFPKDEDIAKGNYKLTPQNNAMVKEASEMAKLRVGPGDEEGPNGGARYPRRSANKVEPQKIGEYKGSDYEPKLHKYDTAYAYDRCDSPYALNYLNSKGFSHAIPEPSQDPASDGPRAAQPRAAQGDFEAPRASPSSRPRRRSVGGGCCCSKGAVEVDDQRPQVRHRSPEVKHHSPEVKHHSPEVNHHSPEVKYHSPEVKHHSPEVKHHSPEVEHHSPEVKHHSPEVKHHSPEVKHHSPEVKHHSPGMRTHTPEVDPGVHPGTIETEPVYMSTIRYSFRNPGLVRPHFQFPDFDSASPTTKPRKAAVDVTTPSAELRSPKPRVKYRTTCCSDSDVDTIDSPRRPSARIHYRTPTPEVDLNINKPVVKVHPPEKIHVQSKVDPPEKIRIQGKANPPEKIYIRGKVDPPEKINIRANVDPPEEINIRTKVDPPEEINIQDTVDPPGEIHIQSPRVVVPKANFNNPRYTLRGPNPTLRAKGLKTGSTISRPSLRLAQPRTNYRVKTPPKLTFRRPRLSPIKPLRVNLPSLRRSKPNEADTPKAKPNTETARPRNPKVVLNAPRVRLSQPSVKGPEIQKPAVSVRRPERPSVKVNGKKLAPNATVDVPPKRPLPALQIKNPRPVEATVAGPELEFRDPYHFSAEIPTPPSSRINSPELHLPRPDLRPPKPIHAEIRASEPSLPKAELKGDVTPPKISVKPKKADIPVSINDPDFNFEGPDIHVSDPEFQRQDRPRANANTETPVDAKFQPDAPRIRNPKVATYTPRSMIKPTFADLQINAPRPPEVTGSPPRIRTPDFEPKEPHVPFTDESVRPGKFRIPEPKAEIEVPEFPDPPEVQYDATPPTPELRVEVEKPSVSLSPTKPPTFHPPTGDPERSRPERNTISLPRLPQPPRASVKLDPIPPPKKQPAPPPRKPSPPELVPPPQRSSLQKPPTQRPPQQQPSPQRPQPERSPPQGPPPTDRSRDQNPPWVEPIKWRLRPNTNKSPRGGGGGGDHEDVEPGLTYYPPSKATIAHRILNGPLVKSRLT